MKSILKAALSLALLAGSSVSAYGQGTIFVPAEHPGTMWWNSKFEILVDSKSDAGIDVAAINAFLSANRGMREVDEVCYIGFINDRTVLSPSRAVNAEIQAKLKEYPGTFDQTWDAAPGHRLRVRIAALENCKTSEFGPFLAVVITDESGKVIDVDAQEWSFLRLYKNSTSNELLVLGCFDCGELVQAFYDAARNRVYYEWAGH